MLEEVTGQREITDNQHSKFVARPAPVPPEVTIDPTWKAKIEEDFKEAQATALPEDEEDL